jgi:hypothetical protein
MIKQGRLAEPYKGVVDCFQRVIADEGIGALWRGNLANGMWITIASLAMFLLQVRCHSKLMSNCDG